jgi:hypothetical protein
METGCDTDHYLFVSKFRERLVVNKQTKQKFYMEKFKFKELNEVQGKDRTRLKSNVDSQLWKT